MVQVILGLAAKLINPPKFNYVTLQTRRNGVRLFHLLFGIGTAGVLYAQVYTGFQECAFIRRRVLRHFKEASQLKIVVF